MKWTIDTCAPICNAHVHVHSEHIWSHDLEVIEEAFIHALIDLKKAEATDTEYPRMCYSHWPRHFRSLVMQARTCNAAAHFIVLMPRRLPHMHTYGTTARKIPRVVRLYKWSIFIHGIHIIPASTFTSLAPASKVRVKPTRAPGVSVQWVVRTYKWPIFIHGIHQLLPR